MRRPSWAAVISTIGACGPIAMLLLARPDILEARDCGTTQGSLMCVSNTGVPFRWDTTQPIAIHLDEGPLGSLSATDAVTLVQEALDVWGQQPTLDLAFSTPNGSLVADGDVSTCAELSQVWGKADGKSPVVFDHDGSLMSCLGLGSGISGFSLLEVLDEDGFEVLEAAQIYNGSCINFNAGDGCEHSIDAMRDTMVHELGHVLNLDHVQVNGQWFLDEAPGSYAADRNDPGFGRYGAPPDGSVNIMFPFILEDERFTDDLGRSELSAAELLYGNGSEKKARIAGTVFFPDGVSHLRGANVIARNDADPFFDAVSVVSGFLFNPTGPGPGPTPAALEGAYHLGGLTAGAEYTVEVTQVYPSFRGGSSVGPVDPPLGLPIEEFYNGANEGNDANDVPSAATLVTAATGGSSTGIDILQNCSVDDIVLSPRTVQNKEAYFACDSIRAGDGVVVLGSGELLLAAEGSVSLGGGFELRTGGVLRIRISP
jgi:hypothetical protein